MKVSLYDREAKSLLAKARKVGRNHAVYTSAFSWNFGLSYDHTKHLPTPNALPAMLANLARQLPNVDRERVVSLYGEGTIWLLSAIQKSGGRGDVDKKNLARFVRALGAPVESVTPASTPSYDPNFWLWLVPDEN